MKKLLFTATFTVVGVPMTTVVGALVKLDDTTDLVEFGEKYTALKVQFTDNIKRIEISGAQFISARVQIIDNRGCIEEDKCISTEYK
jgi:hypothetical protein